MKETESAEDLTKTHNVDFVWRKIDKLKPLPGKQHFYGLLCRKKGKLYICKDNEQLQNAKLILSERRRAKAANVDAIQSGPVTSQIKTKQADQ